MEMTYGRMLLKFLRNLKKMYETYITTYKLKNVLSENGTVKRGLVKRRMIFKY